MSDLLIGTSGYDYPEWKGVFYPEDLKRKDFLSFYATQFNALELNNTFYNMPTAERLLSFYERTEGKLSFSVKANRLLLWSTKNESGERRPRSVYQLYFLKDCKRLKLYLIQKLLHLETKYFSRKRIVTVTC